MQQCAFRHLSEQDWGGESPTKNYVKEGSVGGSRSGNEKMGEHTEDRKM